jgi:hypothetical protein
VDTWAFLRRRIKPMITKAEHPAMAMIYANPANKVCQLRRLRWSEIAIYTTEQGGSPPYI